ATRRSQAEPSPVGTLQHSNHALQVCHVDTAVSHSPPIPELQLMRGPLRARRGLPAGLRVHPQGRQVARLRPLDRGLRDSTNVEADRVGLAPEPTEMTPGEAGGPPGGTPLSFGPCTTITG